MENFGRDVRKCQIECLCNTMNKYALSHVKVLNFSAWKERTFFCENKQAFLKGVKRDYIKCGNKNGRGILKRGKARKWKVPENIFEKFWKLFLILFFEIVFYCYDFFYFNFLLIWFETNKKKKVCF